MEAGTSECAPNPHESQTSAADESQNDTVTIQKIQQLLKTKNDTSRFVGLALLKSVLDNSQQLREDEPTITGLWQSASPKFLDRMLRSGSSPSNKDAKDMIDIAVAVLHTFSTLLPEHVKRDRSLVGRIPALVAVILYRFVCTAMIVSSFSPFELQLTDYGSSHETTQLILQTLLTLVNSPEGATAFVAVDDGSPLIEVAPSQPLVLDIFVYAYAQFIVLHAEASASLRSKIDQTVNALVVSFRGTDAVTLLAFLDQLLRRLDPEV